VIRRASYSTASGQWEARARLLDPPGEPGPPGFQYLEPNPNARVSHTTGSRCARKSSEAERACPSASKPDVPFCVAARPAVAVALARCSAPSRVCSIADSRALGDTRSAGRRGRIRALCRRGRWAPSLLRFLRPERIRRTRDGRDHHHGLSVECEVHRVMRGSRVWKSIDRFGMNSGPCQSSRRRHQPSTTTICLTRRAISSESGFVPQSNPERRNHIR